MKKFATFIGAGIACLGIVLSGAPAMATSGSTPESEIVAAPLGNLTPEIIESQGLELREDGFYYAPGDDIPTIDDFEFETTTETEPESTGIVPFTTKVSCGTRTDWYRLKDTNGKFLCFRDKGDYTKPGIGYWNNIRGHCPGANVGRFSYYHSGHGIWAWSNKRGPYANHSTCDLHKNGAHYAVARIQIS